MNMSPESAQYYNRKPIVFGDDGEFEMLDSVEHVTESNGRHVSELALFFKNRVSGEQFGVEIVLDTSMPQDAMKYYDGQVSVADISPTTVLKFMHQPTADILAVSQVVDSGE